MSALVDTYITYRIITTLVKPWKEQDAYEFGIIDEKAVAALVFLREEAEDNKELKKLLGEDYAKEK